MVHKFSQWRWIWLPLAFFMMGSAWAIASPVASSPDDDFHLASIWCAQGDREQVCQDTGLMPVKFIVAAGAINSAYCFATKPESTGECTDYELNSKEMILTDRVNNVQQLYPSGYYRVMSVFVGSNVESSVYSMRIFNVFLASLLMSVLIRVAPRGIRQATLLAAAVTFVPLGLFLIASTNPSGWAITGTLFSFAGGLALMHRSRWRQAGTWALAIATVVAGSMALVSRVDSAAFLVVVAILILVIAGPQRIRRNIPAVLLIGIMAILGIFTYLTVTPLEASGELGTAESTPYLLWSNMIELPGLVQGIVGSWPLGWNDTVLPSIIPVIGLLVVGALSYAGMSHMWVNKAWAVVIAFAAFVGFPLVFMQTQGVAVGEVIQSRYLLPLFAVLMAVTLLTKRARTPLALGALPAGLMGLGLWLSASLAFWVNAHRYSAGSTVDLFDPIIVWSYGPPLAITTVVAVVATAVFVAGVLGMPRGQHKKTHI